MERRKFTREFKLEAVRLIKDRGVSYVQASQDLGGAPTSDYKHRKSVCSKARYSN
jgi:transposase-like protein